MNFLRLRFLIPKLKLAIDSQFTRYCGKKFQGGTIRTEKKCCLHDVFGYDL